MDAGPAKNGLQSLKLIVGQLTVQSPNSSMTVIWVVAVYCGFEGFPSTHN